MTTVYIKGHALPYESDIDYFTLFNRLGSGGAERIEIELCTFKEIDSQGRRKYHVFTIDVPTKDVQIRREIGTKYINQEY